LSVYVFSAASIPFSRHFRVKIACTNNPNSIGLLAFRHAQVIDLLTNWFEDRSMAEQMVAPLDEGILITTEQIVEELLEERQSMLVLFCKVAGLAPFHHERTIREELKEFCQILVDYTALVHLEIYERIVDGKELRQDVVETAEQLHEQLVELTTQIIDFNDKYDESDHQLILNHLGEDLSELGEILAARAELEDRLIQVLLG
jgi:regulator of sigma D